MNQPKNTTTEISGQHPNKKLVDGWKFVQETGINKLKKILAGDDDNVSFTSEEYMFLYTTVFNLCTNNKEIRDADMQIHDRYIATLKDYLNSTVLPGLREKDDEFLLRELVHRWSNHKIMVRWLTRFLSYLDRFYVDRKRLPSLKKDGTIHFRDLVYNELETKLTGAVTRLIDREREGEKIDRGLLKNVVDFYVEIGAAAEDNNSMKYYTNDLEKAVIKETAAYYPRKASSWIVHDSCPEYMIRSEDSLKREKDRVFNYLHSSTEQPLLEAVQHELLTVVSSQLLEKENSGCKALLRSDRVDDLSRMYRLFSKVPHGLDPVALAFKNHVTEEGMALVKQAEDAASSKKAEKKDAVGSNDQNFIRNLIDLHEKYLNYVETCFCSHTLFHKSLKEAFEVFCNKDISGNSSAELLATFLDNLIRKADNEAIEETQENVVRLLAYISDKDLFAEFYRKKLARRLVAAAGEKKSDENDRSILSKFKQAYGGQFTSKMEGMLNDMMLSRENQNNFEEYIKSNPEIKPGIGTFEVSVLTTGFWPTYKSSDYNLPSEMVKCVEVFQDFYKTKTNHRKLTWLFSMGSCNVKALFDTKTIDLVLTTYQASVLLLFNACPKLSFEEIVTQLNLPEDDVIRLLHSLSCAKYKILNKLPETKTISTTDVFEFNPKFTDKMRKVKVPLPPLDDKKKVVEDVEQDRRYAVDAAVVRIMKSRKVLGYQKLVMECVEMLGRMFKPDVKLIKKRIEHLISSDYLERDKENPNMFKYLA